MNDKYIYQGVLNERVFGPLPVGDYGFKIAAVDEPYFKNDKWILTAKLTIEPSGHTVFYRPWSGTDRNGEVRDGIADLLVAVARVPELGTEPNWKDLVGAQGKARLKVETASQGTLAGKEVNAVHWLHRPKELEQSAKAVPTLKSRPPVDPDLDPAPDDIPF